MTLKSRLLTLIKKGETKSVKLMLEKLDLSQSLDTVGATLLRHSAKHGNVYVAHYLIKKGVNVNAQNLKGRTALMKAVEGSQLEVVRYLLRVANINPLLLHHENKNALQMICARDIDPGFLYAFMRGFRRACSSSEEAAEKLIDAGCQLYQAVFAEDAKVLDYMLERGFPVNPMDPTSKVTALHVAVLLNDTKIMKVLLNYGADVEAMDDNWHTPLHYVYESEDMEQSAEKVELLQLLLSHGADPTASDDDGLFQIGFTLVNGNFEMIRVLLPYLDFTATDGLDRHCALHYLAKNRNPGVIAEMEVYCWQKRNVNAASNAGHTALHVAAIEGNVGMVEFLLDRGADVDHAENLYGRTALYYAYAKSQNNFYERYDRCIELLLQHGADPQWKSVNNARFTVIDAVFRDGPSKYKRLKPVIAQLAVLEELGTPISDIIRGKIRIHDKLVKHFDRCRRLLKKEIHESVTLLKLLTGKQRNLEKYAGNKGLLLKLKRIRMKQRVRVLFSYYHNTVTKRFSKAVQCKRLTDAAAAGVCNIFKNRMDRTHVAIARVMEYLNDHDLRELSHI